MYIEDISGGVITPPGYATDHYSSKLIRQDDVVHRDLMISSMGNEGDRPYR